MFICLHKFLSLSSVSWCCMYCPPLPLVICWPFSSLWSLHFTLVLFSLFAFFDNFLNKVFIIFHFPFLSFLLRLFFCTGISQNASLVENHFSRLEIQAVRCAKTLWPIDIPPLSWHPPSVLCARVSVWLHKETLWQCYNLRMCICCICWRALSVFPSLLWSLA